MLGVSLALNFSRSCSGPWDQFYIHNSSAGLDLLLPLNLIPGCSCLTQLEERETIDTGAFFHFLE